MENMEADLDTKSASIFLVKVYCKGVAQCETHFEVKSQMPNVLCIISLGRYCTLLKSKPSMSKSEKEHNAN